MSDSSKTNGTDLSKVVHPETYEDLDQRFRSIFQAHKKREDESRARRQQSYGWRGYGPAGDCDGMGT